MESESDPFKLGELAIWNQLHISIGCHFSDDIAKYNLLTAGIRSSGWDLFVRLQSRCQPWIGALIDILDLVFLRRSVYRRQKEAGKLGLDLAKFN